MSETYFYDSPEMRLIMDARDPKDAKKIFKITDEGMFFSETGIDGPFKECEIPKNDTIRTKYMSPYEFAEKMWRIKVDQESTPEYRHADADDLMCELLKGLGYGDGVRHFEDMEKWYS